MATTLYCLPVVSYLATVTALQAGMDVREIVRRAVYADDRNWKAARNYELLERVDAGRLDRLGRLRSKEVKTYQVLLLDGTPYKLLAGRDDRPLAAIEERREQEQLARAVAARRRETPAQKAQRLAEYDKRPDWIREAWQELAHAFDFRLESETLLGGRTLYVIAAQPHPGYQAKSRTTKAMAHVKGRLWVEKLSYHLVKAEVEAIDSVSVGLLLVRIAKGAQATFEQVQVTDEVWLPQRVHVSASARVAVFSVLHIEHEITYSAYRELHAQPKSASLELQRPPRRTDLKWSAGTDSYLQVFRFASVD